MDGMQACQMYTCLSDISEAKQILAATACLRKRAAQSEPVEDQLPVESIIVHRVHLEVSFHAAQEQVL